MNWLIPSKTFLVGEYSALAGGSAILLTNTPCFGVSLLDAPPSSNPFHPHSPAGRWLSEQKLHHKTLLWHDPYHGIGGLGASSAQFIGVYLASCATQNKKPQIDELFDAYCQYAWSGKGQKPSGYDVLAQAHHGCVFINYRNKQLACYSWPFADLSFTLVHTGVKLATHQHLEHDRMPVATEELSQIANETHQAFIHKDSQLLISCINAYQNKLEQMNLMASHSIKLIKKYQKSPYVLAIKGCGALGSDTLLLITKKEGSAQLEKQLKTDAMQKIATELSLSNFGLL